MRKRITDFVDVYFADLPCSDDIKKARNDIIDALCFKFVELAKNNTDVDAFESLVGQYGKLSDMAELAGYSANDVTAWRAGGAAKDLPRVKKEFRKQRRRIYLLSILGAIVVVELFWLVHCFVTAPLWSLFVFLFMGIVAGGATLVIRKFIKVEKQCLTNTEYDRTAFSYLRALSDKYAKRRLNGIALSSVLITVFVMFELSMLVLGHSKPEELTESMFPNLILLEIPAFICIKNRLCFDLVYRRIKLPNKTTYKKHYIGVTVFSAAFWLVACVITVLLKKAIRYPANVLFIAGALFSIAMAVYWLVWRKRVVYMNIVINRRRVAVITAVAVIASGFAVLQRDTWYTQPYINSVPVVEHNTHDIEYDEDSGVFTITSSTDDFRILHLTDIHLGGSLFSYRKDIKALSAVYAELEYTKPDFVIVTGDLCFPLGIMSLSFNNSAPVYQFAAFMRNAGIPWAFTYGNHDTEDIASMSQKDLNEVYKQLSYKTSGNLLYPYVQPNITGRNNQLIELRNTDGSFNTALYLIDSNAYTGAGINDYDFIHDDQVEWYAQSVRSLNAREGRTVPSMAFFHIPLQEYRTAYDLYMSGSDEVQYYFGENNEKGKNKICCSDYPSKLFDTMIELESTSAVFCGHDHYNNMSLEYKGIRLTYGMSIDYLAMPGIESDTKQRGAELITIHPDSSWEIEQIPLNSIAV